MLITQVKNADFVLNVETDGDAIAVVYTENGKTTRLLFNSRDGALTCALALVAARMGCEVL